MCQGRARRRPQYRGCTSMTTAGAAVREHDQALRALAHDLTNSLSCVMAYTQLLERQVSAIPGAAGVTADDWGMPLMRTRLANILGIAGRMSVALSVVTDATGASNLVDATHIPEPRLARARALVPARTSIDLVALVRRTLRESALGAREQRVEVRTATSHLSGSWDEVSLGRVLDNLFSNAAKYCHTQGTVTVTVDLDGHLAGPAAIVSVRDEGIGIPAADLPRLFDWAFRSSNVADIPGTGIGLAASREAVERIGGTLSVASEEGVGSTFTVRLPLAP